ncbi:MAG: hypothetical protein ACRD22_02715 [Terriglobia bacterium]
MSELPGGWREATLRAAGITVTQFALDVLSAWRKSTPLPATACNPVGMPAKGNGAPPWLSTPYAVFPGMPAFRAAFARFLGTQQGREVRHALELSESYSNAWRAVHALPWPAVKTESEYPAALLDLVEAAYRDKVAGKDRAKRRTTGTVQAPPEVHAAVKAQAVALHHAVTAFTDGHKAMGSIVKGLR